MLICEYSAICRDLSFFCYFSLFVIDFQWNTIFKPYLICFFPPIRALIRVIWGIPILKRPANERYLKGKTGDGGVGDTLRDDGQSDGDSGDTVHDERAHRVGADPGQDGQVARDPLPTAVIPAQFQLGAPVTTGRLHCSPSSSFCHREDRAIFLKLEGKMKKNLRQRSMYPPEPDNGRNWTALGHRISWVPVPSCVQG